MDGLRLSAFHRRVIGPVDLASLLDLLAPAFRVAAAAMPPHQAPGSFGLYAQGDWYDVTPHVAGAGLDVEFLQAQVLDHLEQTIEIAPARTLVDELTRRCDADGGVALHARAATARDAHQPGGRWRGDAAQDDVLRAQALRRHLPAPLELSKAQGRSRDGSALCLYARDIY